jgi:hypothetical protein
MTQKQINKYSILMAEFMGFKNDGTTFIVFGFVNNKISVKFHTSYDWLMPVWVKFRDMYEPELGKALWDVKENIKTIIVMKPIEEAFEELGKAIEWYNTIKK